MSKKKPKVSMAEVRALMTEANNLGANLTIPRPKDRPLVILDYKNSPEPSTVLCRSTKQAKAFLVKRVAELKAAEELTEEN
ncbi:MAG: hypothetical protein ACE5OZ_16550 [Candidatus Heimdallarchaeota archaeon]